MAIENILILGNWETCLTIINAFFPSDVSTRPPIHIQLSVLTYPLQTLSLPKHVPSSSVHHRTSDFSPESLQAAFHGQDLVISTMSGGDASLQILIVNSILSAGVKRFIPHEFSHDTLNEAIQSRITKHAGRAKVINHLKAVSRQNKDFEWVAIATGYTLDTNLISGALGFDMQWHSATVHGIGTELFAASSLQRIGHVVAKVLEHWEQVKNQYIYAAGCITCAEQVLRCAETVTGKEFSRGNHEVQECIREGEARIDRGFPDAGMVLLERSVLYDEKMDASKPFREKNANEILQLETEKVEEIVSRAYHDLMHHGKPGCACST